MAMTLEEWTFRQLQGWRESKQPHSWYPLFVYDVGKPLGFVQRLRRNLWAWHVYGRTSDDYTFFETCEEAMDAVVEAVRL